MALKWFPCMRTGELRARHPLYHDDGGDLFYDLVCIDLELGIWVLKFEGAILSEGPLSRVMKDASLEAREAAISSKIAKLKQVIWRLERSQGGSWRRLRSLQKNRDQLSRLLSHKRA